MNPDSGGALIDACKPSAARRHARACEGTLTRNACQLPLLAERTIERRLSGAVPCVGAWPPSAVLQSPLRRRCGTPTVALWSYPALRPSGGPMLPLQVDKSRLSCAAFRCA